MNTPLDIKVVENIHIFEQAVLSQRRRRTLL